MFLIEDLEPGSYMASAERAGSGSQLYGARRPGETGLFQVQNLFFHTDVAQKSASKFSIVTLPQEFFEPAVIFRQGSGK
jgi:hypothetical protein